MIEDTKHYAGVVYGLHNGDSTNPACPHCVGVPSE